MGLSLGHLITAAGQAGTGYLRGDTQANMYNADEAAKERQRLLEARLMGLRERAQDQSEEQAMFDRFMQRRAANINRGEQRRAAGEQRRANALELWKTAIDQQRADAYDNYVTRPGGGSSGSNANNPMRMMQEAMAYLERMHAAGFTDITIDDAIEHVRRAYQSFGGIGGGQSEPREPQGPSLGAQVIRSGPQRVNTEVVSTLAQQARAEGTAGLNAALQRGTISQAEYEAVMRLLPAPMRVR